jgi:hypothetical protein
VPDRIRTGPAGSVIALTVLAAACAGPGNSDPSPATAAAPPSAPVTPSAGAQLSAQDAEAIALETVGSGQVLSTEVDDVEIKIQVWEVTVATADGLQRKVSVDMSNGSILGDEVDD